MNKILLLYVNPLLFTQKENYTHIAESYVLLLLKYLHFVLFLICNSCNFVPFCQNFQVNRLPCHLFFIISHILSICNISKHIIFSMLLLGYNSHLNVMMLGAKGYFFKMSCASQLKITIESVDWNRFSIHLLCNFTTTIL